MEPLAVVWGSTPHCSTNRREKRSFMKKNKHIAICLVATVLLCLGALSGCTVGQAQEDIIVLYTNDVHCGIDESIGYAGLASYKALCEAKTPYVSLVDCGDAVQGDAIGTMSKGESIVTLMNAVGYDFSVLGNHEFDYGMEQLTTLMSSSESQYLGCNLTYSGSGENPLQAMKPYEIVEYGDISVAYIGVLTPETTTKSNPAHFTEDGNVVYDFYGESGEALYSCVQGYVDECKAKDADYVILLSHLGDDEESSPFTSFDLIRNTTGVDAVLDGHSHSVVSCRVEQNRDGDTVLLSSTGTKLENIGQLVISANGTLSTGLISHYEGKDTAIETAIQTEKDKYEKRLQEVVATSDVALSGSDAEGVRLVRSRETTIGDFCADAYRAVSGADIAVVNGGGIRADLPAGDITYGDILGVHPYGNSLCVVKATGQEILDCLEMASRFTTAETSKDGNPVGESGGFLQVSGLKYTINTSIDSTVTLDEDGMFTSVAGARRISDVSVLGANNKYEPLDPKKVYTLASHDYMLKSCGDGFTMFADNEAVIDEGMSDYQILITYLNEGASKDLLAQYKNTEGRITVS